jgi:vitamin B12 transporter
VGGISYHHQNRTGNGDGNVSYLVGGRLDVHQNTRLKASLSRKIRFPSIRQLYDTSSGNINLNAERTIHYELGLTQTLAPGTSVSATGFIIDAQDFIEKDGNNRYQNYETYRFQGFELALESRPIGNLTLNASYAYLNTEDQSAGAQKEDLQYRPRDKVSISGVYRFPFGLTTSASLLYVGNQYFYDSSTPANKQALNNYTTIDLKLTQALIKKQLEIYLGIDNLLDKNYEQSYGLPQPGRLAYAGLKLTR